MSDGYASYGSIIPLTRPSNDPEGATDDDDAPPSSPPRWCKALLLVPAAALFLLFAGSTTARSHVTSMRNSSKYKSEIPILARAKTGEQIVVPPLSNLSPTKLGLIGADREDGASPSDIWGDRDWGPLPTNSWYLVRCIYMDSALLLSQSGVTNSCSSASRACHRIWCPTERQSNQTNRHAHILVRQNE
jgi:hypothetical protein